MSIRFPIVIAAVACVLGCRVERQERAGALAPPPADVREAAAKGNFAVVAAYARTLPYDTLHGSGDRQRLMVGTRCAPWGQGSDCRYGPLVTIQPEHDAYHIPDTIDLARGRVVARLMTADSAYRKLNVWPNDTTYWWMDRGGPGGKWRAVLLSSNPERPTVIDSSVVWHPSERGNPPVWYQAIARFEWSDKDETLWVTCLVWGCCRLDDEIM